jgi:hypothetical protein
MRSRMSVRRVLALVVLSGIAACAPMDPVELFKSPNYGGMRQATFELECPEKDLVMQSLGAKTVGVTGCGKKAVYKSVYGVGWVNSGGAADARTDRKSDGQ